MFWDRKKDDQLEEHAEQSSNSTVRRRKLKPELQQLVDREEELLDNLHEGTSVDTTDTPYRYAAYATRIRTLLLSAHRYVAYTSDIGESFRPVAHPWLVRGAYGISWAYICGDVANEGYKAYVRNRRVLCPPSEAYHNATSVAALEAQGEAASDSKMHRHDPQTLHSTTCEAHPMPWADPDEDTWTPWSTTRIPLSEDYRSVMAERAVFQALASMGLPALTIHSVVRYSGRALKDAKSVMIRTWGPIGLGLSIVPFLPYVFDKPVEDAVKWTFHKAFLSIGGPDAVPQGRPQHSVAGQTLASLEDSRQRRKEERERRKAERQQRREERSSKQE